jgi:hypothetical protein
VLVGSVSRCREVMSMRDIDFDAVAKLGVGLSTPPVREGVILATGVRRESRKHHSAVHTRHVPTACGRPRWPGG